MKDAKRSKRAEKINIPDTKPNKTLSTKFIFLKIKRLRR